MLVDWEQTEELESSYNVVKFTSADGNSAKQFRFELLAFC